jgi:hypothetical protein
MSSVAVDQARCSMWKELIPHYESMNRNQKKQAKLNYAAERGLMPHNFQLDCCAEKATAVMPSWSRVDPYNSVGFGWAMANKKQETEMYAPNIQETLETQKRNYLSSRLSELRETNVDKLRQAYGMDDDDRPMTPKEFIQRIKDGKYVIEKDQEDTEDPYSVMSYIRWRDPAKVEDSKGYKIARDILYKTYNETKDAVIILPLEDALAAVKKFEETKFE